MDQNNSNEHNSNNFVFNANSMPATSTPANQATADNTVPQPKESADTKGTTVPQPNTSTHVASTAVPQAKESVNIAATTAPQSKASTYSASTTIPQPKTSAYAVNTAVPVSKTPEKEGVSKRMPSGLKTFMFGFLGALLAFIIAIAVLQCTGFFKGLTFSVGGTTLGSETTTKITNADDSDTLAEAVSKKCLPSVVSINVYAKKTATGPESLASLGSGVILSKDGYVITNQHVIEGASSVKVNTSDGEKNATIIGEDASSDIAVIKIENVANLAAIELADSDSIKTGQWVMSIGSPFGLEQSVATGIVSATSRSQVVSSENDGTTKVYPNLIQTDAAINPGNSGGALVNSNGQLIGINALITSNSGNYSGVGFAIPTNYAVNLAKQIIEGKKPTHAQLGVTMSSVNSTNSKQYGLSSDKGAYVSSVVKGGAADAAGIQEGDIIVAADGKEITTTSVLLLVVRSHNPGEKINITYNRKGTEASVDVTLGSDEGQTQQKNNNSQKNNSGNMPDIEDLWKYYFGQ